MKRRDFVKKTIVIGAFTLIPKFALLSCSSNNYNDIDSLINTKLSDYMKKDGIGTNQDVNSNYDFIEKGNENVQLQGINISADNIFIIAQDDIIVKISLIVNSKTLNNFKSKLKENGKKIEIATKNIWGAKEIVNNIKTVIELCNNNSDSYNQIVIKSLNSKGII